MHPRLLRELKTVRAMIKIYCRAQHNTAETLCTECLELSEYAEKRLAACPFQEDKSSCGNCLVHCYKPSRREQIKKVMRFSGPKMIFYHPFLALAHLVDNRRQPVQTCSAQVSEKTDNRSD